MLTLTFSPGTIAAATAIALEEAGVPYTPHRLDFANGEQTKESYLKINPKGRVPALIFEDGTVMTETGSLLEYIAETNPDANLGGETPQDAAHMRAVMYYIASTMHVAHAHKMRGARWADAPESLADMTAKVPQTMAACAAFVESDCLRGDYVLGDQFCVADAYLFTICNWLGPDGVTIGDFPKVQAFLGRMEARDSVKAVRAKGFL